LASPMELLGVLLGSFALNLIPFAGPSNLLIASNAALLLEADPLTLGILVALGSASAKLVQYVVTYFIGGRLSQERRERLNKLSMRFGKWAFLTLLIAAATPIPDEPVIISLGLMKYNPIKFTLAVFLGKISITTLGAYLGQVSQTIVSSIITQEVLIILSIVLTVIITVALLKIDLTKIARKIQKNRQ
jgi:membrane protein YqaA with SNARE-associated domain